MAYFKDNNNGLHFLDDVSFTYLLSADCVPITDEEATTIQAQQEAEALAKLPVVIPPTKEDLLVELQALTAKINALGATP